VPGCAIEQPGGCANLNAERFCEPPRARKASALPIRSREVLRRAQRTCRRPAPRLPRTTSSVPVEGTPQATSRSRALSGEAPRGGRYLQIDPVLGRRRADAPRSDPRVFLLVFVLVTLVVPVVCGCSLGALTGAERKAWQRGSPDALTGAERTAWQGSGPEELLI
jgi:hypothetical protein